MSRFLPGIGAVLGLALVAAGGVVFAVANGPGSAGDFGWTTYAPLEPGIAYRSELTVDFSDGWAVLWTGRHLLGASLVVVGLLVLAGLAGWLMGRRQGRSRRP